MIRNTRVCVRVARIPCTLDIDEKGHAMVTPRDTTPACHIRSEFIQLFLDEGHVRPIFLGQRRASCCERDNNQGVPHTCRHPHA